MSASDEYAPPAPALTTIRSGTGRARPPRNRCPAATSATGSGANVLSPMPSGRQTLSAT